jgi:hypothetical protein
MNNRVVPLLLAAVLAGCAARRASIQPSPAAAEIVATELAFAADLAQMGATLAFRKYVAPEAVSYALDSATGRIQRQSAKARLEQQPVRPPAPPGQALKWWPVFAGMAKSGDLGFTTGPFYGRGGTTFGFVFTVWRKQPDGSWRWIWDGGPNTTERPVSDSSAHVSYLPASNVGPISPRAAKEQIDALERQVADEADSLGPGALLRYLAPEARVMGSGAQPAVRQVQYAPELLKWGTSFRYRTEGLESSTSGDLVFTYGLVDLVRDGAPIVGGHMRIWQRRSAGWTLVFAQILLPPRARPAGAPATASPGMNTHQQVLGPHGSGRPAQRRNKR